MSQSTQGPATVLIGFQEKYLIPEKIGIRKFAELTKIPRVKLVRFFKGKEIPTEEHLRVVANVMTHIEENKSKRKLREIINTPAEELFQYKTV